eukprot:12250687-Ditylum_brightwellii.AAC.1
MYKITTSLGQIASFQNDLIQELIAEASSDDCQRPPPKSSVDWLINDFEATENVTFVYVKHSVTLGFVTVTKTTQERTSIAEDAKADVEAWRKG